MQVKLIKMGGRLVRHSRRLTGLAGPDYDATISFGLPIEPEDSQYGKSRLEKNTCHVLAPVNRTDVATGPNNENPISKATWLP